MSKKDRDHLRQKYANAKNNFTIVVVRVIEKKSA